MTTTVKKVYNKIMKNVIIKTNKLICGWSM